MIETQQNTLWSCGVRRSPLAFYKICREVYIRVGSKQFETGECIFVRYENNVKTGSVTVKERRTLTSLLDMEIFFLSDGAYHFYSQEITVVITLLYVDNTGIRFFLFMIKGKARSKENTYRWV